jgi:thiamine-phosphate pyrophosphorylase
VTDSPRSDLARTLADSLRLYVLTDRALARGRFEVDVARDAIAGGATAIQLRWKDGPLWEAMEIGRQLRTLCRQASVLFVVNDRVDLALALEADGVHLGEHDLPVREARRLVDDRMIIGFSPATLVEAVQAQRAGADYLGVGPIFATWTKHDAGVPVGTERIRDVTRSVGVPVVGIGGITAGNAGAVIEAGAAGVAVISAVVARDDVVAATRELRQAVDHARSTAAG